MRTLRVAGVQTESRNGEVQGNLDRAEVWVGRAAEGGAELVLCSELLAAGYVYHPSIWRSAEPRHGPTEVWLRRLAVEHQVYLGASYLEVQGTEFFNTFTLAAPDGGIAGRVRKLSLPSCEGWFFRSGEGPRFIDCDLGRLGVGICNDNQTAAFALDMYEAGVDLLLMPHSCPVVSGFFGFVSPGIIEQLEGITPCLAQGLGVPAVMVNKASRRPTPTPFPAVPLARLRFTFPGLSTVCDAEGRVLRRLEDEQGLILADVTLDSSRRATDPPPTAGYWSLPPKHFPRLKGGVWQALGQAGRFVYRRSRARRQAARSLTRAARASRRETVARNA